MSPVIFVLHDANLAQAAHPFADGCLDTYLLVILFLPVDVCPITGLPMTCLVSTICHICLMSYYIYEVFLDRAELTLYWKPDYTIRPDFVELLHAVNNL